MDWKKYGSLIKSLQSQYSLGKNQYPETVSAANDILASHKWDDAFKAETKNWKEQSNNKTPQRREENKDNNTKEGANFNQKTKKVTCFCCGKEGHYSDNCPDKDNIAKKDWAVKQGSTMLNSKKKEEETVREDNNGGESGNNNNTGWMGIQLHNTKENVNMYESVIIDMGATFSSFTN